MKSGFDLNPPNLLNLLNDPNPLNPSHPPNPYPHPPNPRFKDSLWKQTSFHWCMTFFLNDKRLLKISFVLALDDPKPKRTPFFCLYRRKRLFSNPKIFVIKSTNKTRRFMRYIFYCAPACIYVIINVAIPSVKDSDPCRRISF